MKRADSVHSLGAITKPNLNDSRQSVDRRERIEHGTKDIVDKIAALTDNWMSIKKDQLETITEARPITRESLLAGANKPKKPLATQQPVRAGAKDVAKDKKAEPLKPTSSLYSQSGQGIGLNKAKPPTPTIKMATNLSQSAVAGVGQGAKTFDIGRAFEELDSIKNRMSNQTALGKAPKKSQLDQPAQVKVTLVDEIDPENEDIEELDLGSKDPQGGLAAIKPKVDTLAARRAQRTGAAVAGKKVSVLQKKKMLDDIEAQFVAAFKKVKEFERETGVSVSQTNINREYNKMLDEIREVVKKN